MKTNIYFFVVLLLIPCHLAAQSPSRDPLRLGHALLIGIYQYEDRRWPTLDDIPLQLAVLKDGLKEHFETVEIIENKTSDKIWQKLDTFLRVNGNSSDARLLIYYAGHGYNERVDQYNTLRGYITGTDTPAIMAKTKSEYDSARLKSISMVRIRGPLQEIRARHVLVILDNCFSGTIFNTRSISQSQSLTAETIEFLMGKMARNLITAGSASERIPAHSPLPELFLNAIGGAADNYGHGVVSASEIGNYLRAQLIQRQDIRLTPQEGPLEGEAFAAGEFLFRVVRRPQPSSQSPPLIDTTHLLEAAFNYRDGRGGLNKDDREAARLFRLAADQGDDIGQLNLGFFYEQGRGGLNKDEREAARFYRLAADQGYALGQSYLGVFYRDGRGGLNKDEREAARLFRLAADQGNPDGQVKLGWLFEVGHGGLNKDEREAARLYRLAADQGDDYARNALQRLDTK